jgi:glyoxylase-like metal-dependent hydrolase (beta-lactamase superfamily II)
LRIADWPAERPWARVANPQSTIRIPQSHLMTHTTFRVGHLTCHALEGGRQHLDGGAMFGVVPKPLWERRITADARNRIPLALRCLLIEHEAGLVLVDSGAGNKESAKFVDIYGLENAGAGGRTALEDALGALGHRPEDVAWVINTHLHFDHAGGNTWRDEGGALLPAFPNARYVVQRGELEFARLPNERIQASYLPHNFAPIDFLAVSGEAEPLPGIRCLPTPGHVPWHQSILVESAGERACFLGDLVPTTHHLPLPWVMGYDVEPLRTLESRRALYARAVAEDWLLVFEHDPVVALGRLQREERGVALVEPRTIG